MLTSFGRKIKQINVLLGWFILLLLIVSFIWILVAKPKPKDKIEALQIGNIRGVLQSEEKAWEPPFTYIVTADILNPNDNFQASKVSYIFELKDKKEKIINQKEGTTELPIHEQKTIREEITIDTEGNKISFQLTQVKWERSTDNR